LTSRQAPEIPGLDDIAVRAIEEALAVAAAKGRDLRGEVNPDAIVRPAGGRSPGRSSMLQDVDAGRALEVEGIVGQVVAFAREAGVKTPTLDVVLPLLRGLDHAMKLAREGKS
jgi:2-dehydropantoate 2-reductase